MVRRRALLQDEKQELTKKIKLEARKTKRLMAKSGKRLSASELIDLLRAKTQVLLLREKASMQANTQQLLCQLTVSTEQAELCCVRRPRSGRSLCDSKSLLCAEAAKRPQLE